MNTKKILKKILFKSIRKYRFPTNPFSPVIHAYTYIFIYIDMDLHIQTEVSIIISKKAIYELKSVRKKVL